MDLLSDPCNDRVMKDVILPPHKPLTLKYAYPNGKDKSSKPDYEVIKNHLEGDGVLDKALLMKIIYDAQTILCMTHS